MKISVKLALTCLIALSSLHSVQGDDSKTTTERADLMRDLRSRIFWQDSQKTDPLLIPEEVIGLVPYEELPIPEDDRAGIRMWISFLRDWRSPAGQPFPECRNPRRADNSPVPPDDQITLTEAIAEGPVSLLVNIDKTTRGYRPDEGIYQYNEITPLQILGASGIFGHQPLYIKAFLSEGGEIVVEGTRLCSTSPWHERPPRQDDTYLLVGAPDEQGLLHTKFYFRVENGFILPANYSTLKQSGQPLPLDRVLAGLHPSREFNEYVSRDHSTAFFDRHRR